MQRDRDFKFILRYQKCDCISPKIFGAFVRVYTHLYCKLPNRFRDKILSDKEQTADVLSHIEDWRRRLTKFYLKDMGRL